MPPLPSSSTVGEQYAAGEKLRFNRSGLASMQVHPLVPSLMTFILPSDPMFKIVAWSRSGTSVSRTAGFQELGCALADCTFARAAMHTRCPERVKTRRLLCYRNVSFRQLRTYRGARVGRQWARERKRFALA